MLTHRQYLERSVEWRRDEPALVVPGGESVTYAEFDRRTNQVANALRDTGLRSGDRVALVLYNTIEFPLVVYGCYKAGVVPVPLNYMLATANFAFIFDDVHPDVVVYDEAVADAVEPAAADAARPPDRYCVGGSDGADDTFESFVAGAITDRIPVQPRNADEPSYVLYTSGTTGAPKGVTFTAATADSRVREAVDALGLNQDSVSLQVSPWFHAGGLDLTVHPTLSVGGTLLVTEDWEPEPLADTIETYGVTHIVGVPTVAQRLATMDGVDHRDLSTLEGLMCMGSPLSRQLATTLMEHVTENLFNGYGTTETLLDAVLRPEDLPEHAGAVGRPTIDKEVRIVEFDQHETAGPEATVAPGVEGEVVVRSDSVMDYYFGNADATRSSVRDGWYYTDDLGVVDEDGYLTITGRADDMILSGGELVSPIEVEEALEEHDGVTAAVVVGTPDEEWGEVVTAYVVAEGLTDDDLDAYCRSHEGLADYKRPRRYEFVESLERTATGKKQRFKYRS